MSTEPAADPTVQAFGRQGGVTRTAKHISQETQAAHPNVPWSAAARMRDRLVHHYFDINLDVLWRTVTLELPALLDALSGEQD